MLFAALATLAAISGAAVEAGSWKPIHSSETVELPVGSQAGQRLSICADQRDLDLTVTLTSGTVRHSVDATVFGRECIHAISGIDTQWKLTIEASDKRYGRGTYRIASVKRRPVGPSDDTRILAQDRLQAGKIFANNPEQELRQLALREWADAARLARQAGDLRREGEARRNRGALLHSIGRYQESLTEYRLAIDIWTGLADPLQNLVTQFDRDRVLGTMGRHITSGTLHGHLRVWQRVGDRRGLGSVYRGLGDLAIRLQQYGAADAYLTQADRLCGQIDDVVCQAKVTERRASLAMKLGNDEQSAYLLRSRLRFAEKLKDERGHAAALSALAEYKQAKGNSQESLTDFQEVRRLRIAQGDEPSVAAAEANLSAAYRRLGNQQEALAWATAGLKRLEATHSTLSDPLLRTEVRWGHVMEAYLEALAASAEANPVETCRFAALADQARSWFLLQDTDRTLSDIRAVTEPGDVALLFMHTRESSLAWIVEPDGCSIQRLEHPQALDRVIKWRNRLLSGTATAPLHREVSKSLLEPILAGTKARRFLVSPSGQFTSVPFAALLDPDTRYAKVMGETREIVYVPSFAHLEGSREAWAKRGTGSLKIAAIGDAVYEAGAKRSVIVERDLASTTRSVFGSTMLPRLPFSRREVQYVVEETAGAAIPFVGYEATRSLIAGPLSRTFDGLHVAVHGLMNPLDPGKSGLVLSLFGPDGKRVPGFFRLPDILSRDQQFRLVVLSSCQSALGKPMVADTSLGLTSAFLRAGARTVISSLWKVDDEATSITMKHFYRAYFRDGLGPAAALAEAQRKVRNVPRWRSPYYWAGFVVTGDWQR